MSESGRSSKLPKLPFRLNLSLILVVICVLIILGELVLGTGGFAEIEPGEVAVVYNNTGLGIFGDSQRTIIEQGARSYIPGVQTVQKLKRRPRIFVMANDEARKSAAASRRSYNSKSTDISKSLTVRANDGSNFYFHKLEIHYQIIPAEAAKIVVNFGIDERAQGLMVATHSREILRNEFGRYDFLEVANPATYGAATTEAKKLLNDRLNPYGIQITQIITPKPKFEARVEKAIEDRQNAEQEVEVQGEKRRKLDLEKGLKIQTIEQTKNTEYQALIAELESRKKAASNQLISVKRQADKYAIERRASGRAYMAEKTVRAKANEIAYRKAAEGLVAKITAVGAAGPDVLNRVIAEKVFPQQQNVSATPLINPTTPIDIRHINRGSK